MKGKYTRFAVTVFTFSTVIIVFYKVIMHFGFLPLLTNSISFDAKTYAIQKDDVKSVEIMALGSSITLDNINAGILTKNLPLTYYNFSSWGMQISDINGVSAKYLPEYHPKYMLICSSIPDFITGGNMESLSQFLNTSDFVKNHFTELFYIKNYNPLIVIINRRKAYHMFKKSALNFDKYGGVSRNIFERDTALSFWVSSFNFPTAYTSKHYNELRILAMSLKEKHIQLFFVQSPIEQAYLKVIKNPEAIYAHFKVCKSIVEKEGGVYLNYHYPVAIADSLFVDPFHLSGKGAKILTSFLVKDMKHYIKN